MSAEMLCIGVAFGNITQSEVKPKQPVTCSLAFSRANRPLPFLVSYWFFFQTLLSLTNPWDIVVNSTVSVGSGPATCYGRRFAFESKVLWLNYFRSTNVSATACLSSGGILVSGLLIQFNTTLSIPQNLITEYRRERLVIARHFRYLVFTLQKMNIC